MYYRHRLLSAVVGLVVLGILACSMGSGGQVPSEPSVEILSPLSGSRAAIGEEVVVQYRATDPVAIVRVELEAERQIVDSQDSPTREGQPSLSGILRWTPSTAGVHKLLVYAYNRDGVSSDGVGVEITVGEGAAPGATTTPTGETPTGQTVKVALFDDFADPASGWAVSSADTYRQGYDGGEYFIELIEQNDRSRWQTYPLQTFSDFTAEVQVRFEAADDYLGAALIWGWQDNDNFYRLRIRNTGQYDLVKRVDGEWQNLISVTPSPHINTGAAANALKLVAEGNLTQIYVNGEHLADATDDSFAEGRIGFYASVYTGSPITTRIFFDNLKVSVSEEVPGPPAVMSTLDYSDDFNDPESGWTVSSGEGYAYGYEGGEYHIELVGQTDTVRFCTYPERTFSDFTAEVQVQFDTDVERVGGGLIWRWQDNSNYYRFTIYNSGTYGVWKRVDGQWQTKLGLGSSSHIRSGIAVNNLKVVTVGDLIRIYINDQHVGDLVDVSFSEGRVGLNAALVSESPLTARVRFDNLRVYVPQERSTSLPTETVPAMPGACAPPAGRIVFSTSRDWGGVDKDLYVMNADGSGLTRLTHTELDEAMPAWSPDGRRIAFVSWRDRNFEIYVMNADGTSQTRLTNNEARDYHPAWSPDGQRIAFATERDGNFEIYVMNADGSSPVNISNNPAEDRAPEWSPDGQWITFHSDRDGNAEIYLMKPDGSQVVRLTENPGEDQFPSWSPDGQRIAFSSRRLDSIDIYIMNADGTGLVRVTDDPGDDGVPAWSPDGCYLTFYSEREGNREIYIIGVDGSGERKLTNDPGVDGDSEWFPAP